MKDQIMKTDSELQQDVINELKWEPSVKATHIGVEVQDGVVTLTGHVENYGEKWHAEKAAQRVFGVKALAVEMDVRLLGISERSDADIAQSVKNVLLWTTYLPQDAVKILVEKGWVTLSGEVSWNFQKTAANKAVRYLMGVKGVSNQISIKSSVTVTSIKDDIEAALKRRFRSDGNHITIAVDDGNVTLSGTVHTWADRNMITHAAWGTAGVNNVTDNLTFS
jgi:osmotically-inducible protein OsmY